jgi:hypothetical protein
MWIDEPWASRSMWVDELLASGPMWVNEPLAFPFNVIGRTFSFSVLCEWMNLEIGWNFSVSSNVSGWTLSFSFNVIGWTFSFSCKCEWMNLEITPPKWVNELLATRAMWVDEPLATHPSLLLGGSWFIIIILTLLRTSGSVSWKKIRIVLVF